MDRISLGNEEFEGRNNAYVLADDDADALALVDTGLATDPVRRDLRDGLAERGYDIADVDDIVLTHFHADHAGLAGEIQAESDATVYVHEADAPLVAQQPAATAAVEDRRRSRLEEWGVPEDARAELLAFLEAAEVEGRPVDPTPIADGDVLTVGGRTLETIHTPGHAAGLCCFELDGGDEAFVGDAVLPVYTPNVGGADVRVDRPLEKYTAAVTRLADRDYERVWPGHRDSISEPTARALAILEHHRERTETVLEFLSANGPADAWTVSAHLFGDLEGIHIVHGPGEAFAHLDHLRHEGYLACENGDYRLRDGTIDLEDVVPSVRRHRGGSGGSGGR